MPILKHPYSIRVLFFIVVMGMTILAMISETSISLAHQTGLYKEEIKSNLMVYTQLISRAVSSPLAVKDHAAVQDELFAFSIAKDITHIQIYHYDLQHQLHLFSNYQRFGEQPMASVESNLSDFSVPIQHNNTMSVATPIILNGNEIGFAFIQISTQGLTNLIKQTVANSIIELSILILIIMLVTLKLQNIVTEPLTALSKLAKRVSETKDYSPRADSGSIAEINMLTVAFNSMLNQVEEHIQKHQEIETEYKYLHQDLEQKVTERTTALREANIELIKTVEKLHLFQKQLVENEKMASLGDMVAGVAHEVNTPIGLGITASTMMIDKLELLQHHFRNKTLKASSLEQFINEGLNSSQIVYHNLEKAAELIASFKQVAVNHTDEEEKTFCVCTVMDDIVKPFEPQMAKHHHKFNLHCQKGLQIYSKVGTINQIMINLIMNSLTHGFESLEGRQIDIRFEELGSNQMRIIYKDNGNGIPSTIANRIFEPFVTSKRGKGGTGLGMHLVYNLVTHSLLGRIEVKQDVDVGVEFQITIPIKKVQTLKPALLENSAIYETH